MAQTKPSQNLSLALSGQKTGQKQKGQNRSAPAQFMALVSALGSLSSVALSSARAQLVYHLFPASLRPGDISTLQKWGHLYFALTGKLITILNGIVILTSDRETLFLYRTSELQ